MSLRAIRDNRNSPVPIDEAVGPFVLYATPASLLYLYVRHVPVYRGAVRTAVPAAEITRQTLRQRYS
jgi:hypothetical protein